MLTILYGLTLAFVIALTISFAVVAIFMFIDRSWREGVLYLSAVVLLSVLGYFVIIPTLRGSW